MKEHPYLIFRVHNSLYGINTLAVEEVFFLPELKPIPEAPRDIVGVVNVRGDILPVMDLNLRFGYITCEYQVTDSVVIIESEGSRVGLIVNQVQEVRNIQIEEITAELTPRSGLSNFQKKNYISGVARNGEDIIILLHTNNLLNYVETEADSISEMSEHPEHELLQQAPEFCADASEEAKAIFRKRADNLRNSTANEDVTGLKPLAVIILNEELFAIDLKLVREFTKIRKVTPIPCCPPHIIGNMNLRGEILTLIDIRGLLNLPLNGTFGNHKAVVVEAEGIVTGILVQKVSDVMFLNPADITSVPTALHSINDEYLQGTARYKDKIMSILDLPKIFLNGGLIVDEAI